MCMAICKHLGIDSSTDHPDQCGEPLYSNSRVIAWPLQSTRAHNKIVWFTVIHSMSKVFTTINFHDHVFIWNYHLVL